MKWYQFNEKEVFEKLGTSEEGLSENEVKKRFEQYGPNKLPEGEGISRLKIILHQFTSPLIYILLVAGIVTAFLGEYIDTGVIAAVLILNAIIGYFQEYKAETSVRALKSMMVPRAKVVRGGKEKEISSEELVPGDIVLLASGGKVPADLRFFKTTELRIEEAALTGESVPVAKMVRPVEDENLTPGDQTNMGFMGTIVVNGRGRGIVVETGIRTILGQIAREVGELSATATPLQQKIVKFAHFIGLLVLGSAVAISILGFFLGSTIAEIFKIAVAASVAAVPEGLPIVVTITMAIGISRMAKRNAIIRKLPAVETLGSTTVICSDKTGTLTKNEMTVKVIHDTQGTYEVTGSGYDPKGEIFREWESCDVATLKGLCGVVRIGMLCNESSLYEEKGQFKINGDPTEGALIVSAMKADLSCEEEKIRYPQLSILPFESERGFMATLHQDNGKKIIFVKGAPEKVIEMCSKAPEGDQLDREKAFKMAEHFAKDGMRVLAMAYKEAPDDLSELTHQDLEENLIFAGMQGMIDPPRPEAIEAAKGCREAGIRVAMITGDHAVTASAIGEMFGIARERSEVLTGRELETMSDEDLFERVKNVSVYARVSPQHKLRIVKQFMKHGEVVAVTGDGVNDAPALKAAHIGVAMGKTGTDVAREASDMVITDDNFASIFHAVEEGRVVFDNIRKVTLFLIPTGFAAIVSILVAMVLDIPIPYVAAQLLWINLVTNGLQDVALAFEPGEKDVIKRRPRSLKEGIMSRLMYERSILVGLIISAGVIFNFVSALDDGVSLERARTIAVTTMVLFQFFQAWNSRSELRSVFTISPFSNPFLFYSMVAAFLAQIAVVYIPALQWVFRTESLLLADWVQIGLVALTVVVAVEVDKAIRRHRRRPPARAAVAEQC
ncbi:MAG: HAD-IC family P-type ATPase [Deltaproteobacteria bacterium]|nr:HAD-IC family P-type ATPase [Deltaproteobacteria bacterium]